LQDKDSGILASGILTEKNTKARRFAVMKYNSWFNNKIFIKTFNVNINSKDYFPVEFALTTGRTYFICQEEN